MTAIVYDRRNKTIVADSQNTDRSGMRFRMNKIERLPSGEYFLGAGNCYTIGITKRWAETGFNEDERPEYGAVFADPDEYSFSCLVISKDGNTVTLIDDEMQPTKVLDAYVAVGSGAAYCIGAMDAGATALKAVEIACDRDGSVSRPIHQVKIGD